MLPSPTLSQLSFLTEAEDDGPPDIDFAVELADDIFRDTLEV